MTLNYKYQQWRHKKHSSQPKTPLRGQKGYEQRGRMNKEQAKINHMLLKIALPRALFKDSM